MPNSSVSISKSVSPSMIDSSVSDVLLSDSFSFVSSVALVAWVGLGIYPPSVPTWSIGLASLYMPVSADILALIFFTISLGW